ncbi:nucleotidyltransferase domain-containing protein [Thermanaeromonas sp. C210]|uniref:nucleotidyltransferase domain-containing protein n=1 Tax=Thermanaeromonas sp. C210 TaxID=2731925 RepID=UPI00155C744F|nr:nucleotidyltransferase domain-containing protein [Thermanaeromonas sp. C210]GFN21709.1 hypothetical protein TAMC210_00250 [Thermanaeromonas sp. C210]
MPERWWRRPYRSYRKHPNYKELDTFVQQLCAEHKPELILLFGSGARGDYTEESDLDVLVVLDKLKENTWQEVYKHSRGTVLPVVWPKERLLQELKNNNDFLRTVIEEGIFLAGDRDWWDGLRKEFKSEYSG